MLNTIERDGRLLWTTVSGPTLLPPLHSHGRLILQVADERLVPEGEQLLRYIADQIHAGHVHLKDDEPVQYGYWRISLHELPDGTFQIREYDELRENYRSEIELTLTCYHDQQAVCARAGVEFSPPECDDTAEISAGVFEGGPVQGTRFPESEPLSGWVITAAGYRQGRDALQHELLYKLTAARPELAPYLALPVGWRFDPQRGAAWYDEHVASPPPWWQQEPWISASRGEKVALVLRAAGAAWRRLWQNTSLPPPP